MKVTLDDLIKWWSAIALVLILLKLYGMYNERGTQLGSD
jgi:hypothetical protein